MGDELIKNSKELQKLSSFRLKWDNKVMEHLAENPEIKKKFTTISHREVNRIYDPGDIPDFNYLEDAGFPGEYPYLRGIQPTMYRGRIWTMRQYAGFGSAQDTNKRFKFLLDQGQTGLSVAFDLPTQMGYDSDNVLAKGEVGKVGVSIDSIEDMKVLFYDIPLEKVSTSMTINSTASIILAMYIAVAEKQGAVINKLRGTIQNDVLKEYVARGTYIYPPKESMNIITDIFEYCSKHLPKWNTISISGYHIREAGSTAAQELGFTFANAISYLTAAKKRGLKIDEFAPRIAFFFNAHIDFFEEIAKFRAARRIWARLMQKRFQAKNPRSWMLRFHTQTAGCSLTAQQPENNIVRTTLEALSAVLGGTQSLHTNSMDEAIGLPSEKAVRIALKTQQILGYESGVTNSIDPLGGSYFIEKLTDELEQEAMELISRIDDLGGMVEAIETGFVQREIHESAYRFQKDIENGSRSLVGVNIFNLEDITGLQRMRIPPEIEELQCARLKELRSKRSENKVQSALKKLNKCANDNENLMPAILECVKNSVTLGEITEELKNIYGIYRAPDLF